ncbi:MAG: thiamine-binding protein [Eubacteriales bacterium]|nr:thiamine-binding protein [Eubacteriales bacterium]
MQASVAIQVLPQTLDDDEVVRIVDQVIAYIKSTGLHCYVGPYETVIEGDDYEELMDIVKECQLVALRAGGIKKVSSYIKVEYEPNGEILSIDKKVTKHHLDDAK